MKLLSALRSRQRDMKTLSRLITASLERAAVDGDRYAGAHDLLVAAFDLDDRTAVEVFERLGSSGEAFVAAVAEQDTEALRSLGLSDAVTTTAASTASTGIGPKRSLGKSDATYEAAVQNVYAIHNDGPGQRSLIGAHIVAGVAQVDRGVAARAFAAMGLDRERIIAEAKAIADHHAAS